METYLFKFSACLGIFWLVYVLFLERQTMHRMKRFYLLGAFAAAFIIPLLTITYYVAPVVNDFEMSSMFIPIQSSSIEIVQEEPPFWDLKALLWLVYGLGVLLFSARFIVNLLKMYQRISRNENVIQKSFIYVLLNECRIPHSFFKYLFFNKSTYETDSIPKEVLLHEETHAKQLHSLDIMIVELLQIVLWFHPLIYILKHHIKLNHEFLADQAVLNKGIDTKTYQNTLLKFSSDAQEYQLSSAINYSSIKKRFTVMKTQTSKTRIWLSSLLLLPIIAILFYSFSTKEYIEKETLDITQLENTSINKGATQAMMKEYNEWIKKLNDNSSSLFIPVGKLERLVTIYDLMSEEQRDSVDTHPFVQEITPDLYSVVASIPTTSQFESWKNEKEFAIWIDNKQISNSELNNYKLSDIKHYVGSSVHNNAKSKKFPQPFQFHLYTKNGFDKFYKEVYINDYRELTKTYSNAINTYLKGSQTDNSELRIIKAQADKFYNRFSKEDLKQHNILPVPPMPEEKSNKQELVNFLKKEINDKETKILTVLINRKDQFLINDNVGSFDSLKNILSRLPSVKSGQYLILKVDDESSSKMVESVLKLLDRYSFFRKSASKENNTTETFFQQKISDKKATSEEISAYNNWAKVLNEKSKNLENLPKDEKIEGHLIINPKEFNHYRSIYNTMTVKQKEEVQPLPQGVLSDTPMQVVKVKKNSQEKATAKQVADYNAWAKKLNTAMVKAEASNDYKNLIVKQKDIEKYKQIYMKIMSAEQRKNAETWPSFVPPPPPLTSAKQEKATTKQVAQYNAWAKKINTAMAKAESDNDVNEYPIVKVKDVNKYKAIYNRMSESQKKNSEAWPSFPPPPPPPPPIPENVSIAEKARMKKVIENYAKKHPESVNKAKINDEVVEIVEIPMDDEGTTEIYGINYKYIVKDGETTYIDSQGKNYTEEEFKIYIQSIEEKRKLDNLPPPPPASESTLDFVIRMAKTNAKFFYKLKPITSDKAISLLKKNSKLHINAQKTDTKEPLVYISNKPIHIGVKGADSKKEKGGPNPGEDKANIYNSDVKKEYQKKFKQYETLRYTKPHFLKKSKKDKKLMNDLWVELRQMYFYDLSKKEKTDLKLPITPFAPYVKINKDGKSYYKVNSELTDEERKASTMFAFKRTSEFRGLDLLDKTDPIVIPIGTYELSKTPVKEDRGKRGVLISISEDGKYAISKDNTYKNFEIVSLATLEALLSKLSKDEIKNTFIFAENKDAKKFRSKPSASPEYQDDIEVTLVKDDIRFTVMEYNGKHTEHPSYQLVLDNGASDNLKSHVAKLAKLFKKYGISNMTL